MAEKLFGTAELAIDKTIEIRGQKLAITGIITKQGKQMIGGWDFDQSVLISYRFARTIMNEYKADPVIMIQGEEGITSKALKENLTGVVRAIHKLTPTKEN